MYHVLHIHVMVCVSRLPFASLKIGGRSAGLKGSPTMIIYLITRRFRKFHLRPRLPSVQPHPCRHSRLNFCWYFFGTDIQFSDFLTRDHTRSRRNIRDQPRSYEAASMKSLGKDNFALFIISLRIYSTLNGVRDTVQVRVINNRFHKLALYALVHQLSLYPPSVCLSVFLSICM